MKPFRRDPASHNEVTARVAEEAIERAAAVDGDNRPEYPLPAFLLAVLGLAAAWIAIQGLQQMKDIIAPLFFGINLIIVAYPLKRFLVRKGVPEVLGAIASGFVVYLVLLGMFASLVWALMAFIDEIPQYASKFNQLYEDSIHWVARFGIQRDQITSAVKTFDPKSMLGAAQSVLASMSGAIGLMLVIATVLVFLVMDIIGFGGRIEIARDHNPGFVNALTEFSHGVRRYWVVSTAFGLVIAILDWAALSIIGVPLALVWGVLSFVTNYIPNVGFVIGLVPPALMALLTQGWGSAIAVVLVYSILNFVIQSLIQPKVAGDAVGVTPTVSFVSLLFWAWVMGALGAILALPATLLAKALLIDADPEARWVNAFIADTPKSAGVPFRLRRRKGATEARLLQLDREAIHGEDPEREPTLENDMGETSPAE